MKLIPRAVDLVGKALEGAKPEAAIVVAGAGRCRFERLVVRSIRVEDGSIVLDVSDGDECDGDRVSGVDLATGLAGRNVELLQPLPALNGNGRPNDLPPGKYAIEWAGGDRILLKASGARANVPAKTLSDAIRNGTARTRGAHGQG